MRSLTTLFARLALALVALAAFTAPALAAAPSNDTFANAKPVTLGFSETIDTTGATTDKVDKQANKSCTAPATDASVWYTLDGDGNGVNIDVGNSDYSAAVIVATRTQGKLTTLTCAPFSVLFQTQVGTRYYVMAFDAQDDGGGNGGMLSIQFEKSFVPDGDFSVNRYGTLDRSNGSATISGSYTCNAGADFLIFASADQKQGRSTVSGGGEFEGPCDGTLHSWSAVVAPGSGKFTDAKLHLVISGIAYDPTVGIAKQISLTVKLHGGRK